MPVTFVKSGSWELAGDNELRPRPYRWITRLATFTCRRAARDNPAAIMRWGSQFGTESHT